MKVLTKLSWSDFDALIISLRYGYLVIRNAIYLKRLLKIKPTTIVHIGAHKAQDYEEYVLLGATEVHWGEADPELAAELCNKFGAAFVHQGLYWNKSDLEIDFYQALEAQQSSAVPFSEDGPITLRGIRRLKTVTIDQVFNEKVHQKPIMLTLDIQGAELEALRGGVQFLKSVSYVVVEISKYKNVYQTVPTEKQIDWFMQKQGFEKSIFRIGFGSSYKDQLYIKTNFTKVFLIRITDHLFNYLLRLRHLIRTGHLIKNYYHCKKCGF